MNESQYAPGPWKTMREDEYLPAQVFAANGRVIADVFGESRDERAANAFLIAAALDLLYSLKIILPLARAYLKHAPTHPDHAKLETALAAIAKAERKA